MSWGHTPESMIKAIQPTTHQNFPGQSLVSISCAWLQNLWYLTISMNLFCCLSNSRIFFYSIISTSCWLQTCMMYPLLEAFSTTSPCGFSQFSIPVNIFEQLLFTNMVNRIRKMHYRVIYTPKGSTYINEWPAPIMSDTPMVNTTYYGRLSISHSLHFSYWFPDLEQVCTRTLKPPFIVPPMTLEYIQTKAHTIDLFK